MNRRWGRSRGVVALVAGALVLAGCTGEPEPIVTETPSPTPTASEPPASTPTPSPSATALTDEEVIEALPPLARAEDFVGAQEFAKFFLLESQQMMTRQDPRLFNALSAPACDFCNRRQSTLSKFIADDESLQGGSLSVVDQSATGSCTTEHECYLDFEVDIAQAEVIGADGEVVRTLPAEALTVTVKAIAGDGRWKAAAVSAEVRE